MPSNGALDTDPEIERRQVEVWRALSIDERYDLLNQMHDAVEQLARAGISMAMPHLDERGVRKELARRRYGDELADAAFR